MPSMSTNPLENFARDLEAVGFRVYRPGAPWRFIGFAREVDGAWLSATVGASAYNNSEGWEWSMQIVPSREDGSGMFFDHLSPGGAIPNGTPLEVRTAEQITAPRARNSLTSVRENAGWPRHWDR